MKPQNGRHCMCSARYNGWWGTKKVDWIRRGRQRERYSARRGRRALSSRMAGIDNYKGYNRPFDGIIILEMKISK